MIGPSDILPSTSLNPLRTAALGTALAGLASLVWPELLSATLSLASLVTFVVWVRALGVFRRRRSSEYGTVHFLPLVLVGIVGWSTAILLGPLSLPGRALMLGGMSIGLWLLMKPCEEGVAQHGTA